ncbi:hypothetical protein [Campylobacter jejuni]|uniref:hypothetical protein n=1 Tax=Campylobacter jejuni TaxID=197 RepID=UPI00207D3E6E|nr:hypothetical protein [Campylobacter jejuni]
MKITIGIVLILFALIFLSACSFKAKEASELENLTRNYGGIYIFDKKIREEILENERKRTELENDDKFRTKIGQLKSGELIYKIDSTAVDKLLPQVLSNSCKYYRNDYSYKIGESNFNFKDKPEFAYYEDQFKAYMGEENYKKLRPCLGMTTYIMYARVKNILLFFLLDLCILKKAMDCLEMKEEDLALQVQDTQVLTGDLFIILPMVNL